MVMILMDAMILIIPLGNIGDFKSLSPLPRYAQDIFWDRGSHAGLMGTHYYYKDLRYSNSGIFPL